MATTTLENFLKERKANSSEAEERKKNWLLRKDKWVQQVNDLYSQIEGWVTPLNSAGNVIVERKTISLSEEEIGHYSIPQLTVTFEDERVNFKPRGTNLFVGLGRIDVVGKNGQVMLVIPQWGNWSFYELDRSGSIPKPVYEDLTQESFQRIMLDLIS